MKFTTNTKPLVETLSLSVINSNISNFHKKSTLIELTADSTTLRLNTEASQIMTEVVIKGSGDSNEPSTVFVSSSVFKQLVGTLDSPTVTLDFIENGLVVKSGKSEFTVPKLVDSGEVDLVRPSNVLVMSDVPIVKDGWKFIKDHQMFAISMSFIHPVYTKVWNGKDGDVIVGDFDNSLFTYSKKGPLPVTCLLSDTIVNIFDSIPEGAKIYQSGSGYVIFYSSDSIVYRTEFTPMYESDEGVGSYNSDIMLNMMKHPLKYLTVEAAKLAKFLGQADILSDGSEDTIVFSVHDNNISLKGKNVDCSVDCEGTSDDYLVEFKLESIRKILANYGDSKISISSMTQEGSTEIIGIVVWDNDLTTILAGVE